MKSKPCLLVLLLFFTNITFSQSSNNADEKKVDYLESIYFSGENKDGLNTKILIELQELEGKVPTTALAKQVTFLIEIKERANAAENACEILDLLAVGIYNIDAAEAVELGVRKPFDKAKAKSVDALASLSKLNSTANNLSGSASNMAWSSYLLSGANTVDLLPELVKLLAQQPRLAILPGQLAKLLKQVNN